MASEQADMLAQLMRQAEQEGAALVTLRALVEEASEAGAGRAMGVLGLTDPEARRDMDELRLLLQAWRDAKKSAWAAIAAWLSRIILAVVLAVLAMKFGPIDLSALPPLPPVGP